MKLILSLAIFFFSEISFAQEDHGKINLYELSKNGSKQAKNEIIEKFFTKPSSILTSDPPLVKRLCDINSNGEICSVRLKDSLNKCEKVSEIKIENLVNQYMINIKESGTDKYQLWLLAEKLIKSGNKSEALALVCRNGSNIEDELFDAISSIYDDINNNTANFKMCDFVLTQSGMTICSYQKSSESNEEYENYFRNLTNDQTALENIKSSFAFFEYIGVYESFWEGTSRASLIEEKIASAKESYLKSFKSLIEDKGKKISDSILKESEKRLEDILTRMNNKLKTKPVSIYLQEITINQDSLLNAQSLWLKHVESSVKLLKNLKPEQDENYIKLKLLDDRIRELLKFESDYSSSL